MPGDGTLAGIAGHEPVLHGPRILAFRKTDHAVVAVLGTGGVVVGIHWFALDEEGILGRQHPEGGLELEEQVRLLLETDAGVIRRTGVAADGV